MYKYREDGVAGPIVRWIMQNEGKYYCGVEYTSAAFLKYMQKNGLTGIKSKTGFINRCVKADRDEGLRPSGISYYIMWKITRKQRLARLT